MTIERAMVLAAGLGTRFREISGELPKPMVSVAGRPLIDWTLNMLADGGVTRAVVNVHYKASLIEEHVLTRQKPLISISDEREALLETGGGLVKATPLLGAGPFFCSNTDAIFDPAAASPVEALADAWNDESMDALLLMVPLEMTSGYDGQGDFGVAEDGRLVAQAPGNAFVFSGLQLIHPRLWEGEIAHPMSTRVFWDRARDRGRLFSLVHPARWMHVGDPAGYHAAAAYLGDRA